MAGNLKALIGRLDDACRNALEAAAGLCMGRGNYEVDIEHYLLKLVEVSDADITRALRHFGCDLSRLSSNLTSTLDKLKTGNTRTPSLSPRLLRLVEEAWMLASIDYGAPKVRSSHLLLALLSDEDLARLAREASAEFNLVSVESLRQKLPGLSAGSVEDRDAPRSAQPKELQADGQAGPFGGDGAGESSAALEQYTVDLTAAARAGRIDPVLERDPEIRQIVDILTRRRQNNPILTGEAGVGKTAVVEGFALRVAAGDVPEPLKRVSVRALDLGLLQAGAGVRGEFESRLKSVIEEVKSSPRPVILFIDEAHTLIGAGGASGQGDAANLLKPALARGELRTIAATTWAEYKKYFEKDAALARRFQVVKVEEPSEEQCVRMMRGLVSMLEGHHGVRVLEEAVSDAVKLSHRYISGRQLPDKAISVLDTACARVAISQAATPPAVEDSRRRIERLAAEASALTREAAAGADHRRRIAELEEEREQEEGRFARLNEQWEREREIIDQMRDLRARLEESAARNGDSAPAAAESTPADDEVEAEAGDESQELSASASPRSAASSSKASAKAAKESAVTNGSAVTDAEAASQVAPEASADGDAPQKSKRPPKGKAKTQDPEELRAQLARLSAKLRQAQGETPLAQVCVDSQTIAEVISGWTGIPVGRMLTDEINTVLTLRERLEQRVIGQSHALEAISQRIATARANLTDPRRPVGVFLLVGPSGVGKTETALALAETLYGGERNLVQINMSEYQESYTISSLKGSPPGYVGYGEGGVLTEAVRRKPYSVVLLDEMEKAHPDVMELFYQVFDKGVLEDSEGREVDFRHSVIILTSNTGTETIMELCSEPDSLPEPDVIGEVIRPELLKVFKPALLGRMAVVPYYPISDEVMRQIIRLQLERVGRRLAENHGATFSYDEAVVTEIAKRCEEVESGARNIDHILTRTLLPEMSGEFLACMASEKSVSRVHVGVNSDGQFSYVLRFRE
ncbi:MAG: ATP-dependent Clp protease ATP-binding subunit [Acidobacteriota bacterium]|nr:ATP-dependent Clp protease ATP-binding subunit [Acidobacteriota bacterium]